ncbi:UNVERIFIED_CONTAM: hypothetical protein Sindi_2242500, partial [Sesamum indicum]
MEKSSHLVSKPHFHPMENHHPRCPTSRNDDTSKQEALMTLIRDAFTRAATQAMTQFTAHYPMNPPPPSPRRSRELSSTPEEEGQRQEEVNTRVFRPEVAHTQQEKPCQTQQPFAPLLSKVVEDPYWPSIVVPSRRNPFSPTILAEALPTGVK